MPETASLLVEDDANDALFERKALQKGGVTNSIIHLHDGEEAMKYLGGGPNGSVPGRLLPVFPS